MVRPLRCASVAVVAAILLTTACGNGSGKGKGANAPAADRPAAERVWPASRFVSADATMAIVIRRVTDGAVVMRELAATAGVLFGVGLPGIQRELRHELGVDVTSGDDLARIGIDPDGGAALFAQGISPTLVLPVSDPASLQGFIDQLREGVAATMTPRGTYEVASVRFDEGFALEWAVVDGYVLVHVAVGAEVELAWFDAAMAATRGDTVVSGASFGEALAQTRPHLPAAAEAAAAAEAGAVAGPDIVGFLRLDGEVRQLVAALDEDAAACTSVLDGVDRHLFIGVETDAAHADGVIVAPLSPGAAAELASHTAAAPGPGYFGFRAASPLYADWSVDPEWITSRAAGTGCEELEELAEMPRGLPLAGHLAAQHADIDQLEGRAGIWLAVRSKALADRLLDMIPQRRFFESAGTIGGTPVMTISLGIAPDVVYHSSKDRFIAGVGEGVMEQLLGAAPGAQPEPGRRELGGFFIAPKKAAGVLDALVELGNLTDFTILGPRALRALDHFQTARLFLELHDRDGAPALVFGASSHANL